MHSLFLATILPAVLDSACIGYLRKAMMGNDSRVKIFVASPAVRSNQTNSERSNPTESLAHSEDTTTDSRLPPDWPKQPDEAPSGRRLIEVRTLHSVESRTFLANSLPSHISFDILRV